MGLKSTKRQLDKSREKMALLQERIKALEEQERGQENQDMLKTIRKDVDYSEFVVLGEELQRHKEELLKRHKERNVQNESKNSSNTNGSDNGIG